MTEALADALRESPTPTVETVRARSVLGNAWLVPATVDDAALSQALLAHKDVRTAPGCTQARCCKGLPSARIAQGPRRRFDCPGR
jgi:hypothetical protein